jgi:2-methylcitrate dehydratase PrpD
MDIIKFIHKTTWNNLPEGIRHQARRCLLDTIATGIAGRSTNLSKIVYDFAAFAFGGSGALLWLDGREVSPPGAALAHGMTIDALDIHDGHPLAKGHAGAAIVPTVLGMVPLKGSATISGQELLTSLVIGYELSLRAGISLHATVCDYHASGAWNALGCAAVVARRLGLNQEQTKHALGIAEYYGPRAQMMRCIDYPTMIKDGSGWGAMAGTSAAYLAQSNFTGAPAVTVESENVNKIWNDLGQRWQINRQYFKPHATCRWAQPAIEAALALQKKYNILPEQIKQIRIFTFHEAVRLSTRRPQTTEAAQYSLPFPLSAALVHGRLGPGELHGSALSDKNVLRISDCVKLIEDDRFNANFPARRLAQVKIETYQGQIYASDDVETTWDAKTPPTNSELKQKFRWLVKEQIPAGRSQKLEELIWNCADLKDSIDLLTLLTKPIAR